MRVTLNRNHLSVARIAIQPSDPSAPLSARSAVRLGNGEIVATDGYTLLSRKLDTSKIDPMTVPAHCLLPHLPEGVLSASRDPRSERILLFYPNGSAEVVEPKVTFPDCKAAAPDGIPRTVVAVNVAQMTKLLSALGDATYLVLEVFGSALPIRFWADNHNVAGALSTVYLSEVNEADDRALAEYPAKELQECLLPYCLRSGKPMCPDMCEIRLRINLCASCLLQPDSCSSHMVIAEEVGGCGDSIVECDNYKPKEESK